MKRDSQVGRLGHEPLIQVTHLGRLSDSPQVQVLYKHRNVPTISRFTFKVGRGLRGTITAALAGHSFTRCTVVNYHHSQTPPSLSSSTHHYSRNHSISCNASNHDSVLAWQRRPMLDIATTSPVSKWETQSLHVDSTTAVVTTANICDGGSLLYLFADMHGGCV